MREFDVSFLTKAAKKSLEPVDKLILHYKKFGGGRSEIALSRKTWSNLDVLICKKSEGKQSLMTHGYKGYMLVMHKA